MSNYYYESLSIDQKIAYDLIFEGINSLDDEIILPAIMQNEIGTIYNFVLYDNPILFYTRAFKYTFDINNQTIVLFPVYKYTIDFIDKTADLLSDFLSQFDTLIDETDLEKELFVHDYCLNNITYDYDFNEYSFSILGSIIYGIGVCEGISKFVKIVLNYIGVDCMLVSGTASRSACNVQKDEPHMWNIVFINENAYHLDVTFNMSQKGNINRYDYFNLSDDEITKDHVITGSVPICSISGNDYYTLNSQVIYNLSEMENYIQNELLNARTNIVMKLSIEQRDFNIFDYVTSVALRQYQNIYNNPVVVEVKYNPSQYVFEIQFI